MIGIYSMTKQLNFKHFNLICVCGILIDYTNNFYWLVLLCLIVKILRCMQFRAILNNLSVIYFLMCYCSLYCIQLLNFVFIF